MGNPWTMNITHLLSVATLVLCIADGRAFSIYPQVTNRAVLDGSRWTKNLDNSGLTSLGKLCIVSECLNKDEKDLENCLLACQSGGLRARSLDQDPFRRQVDPLQSCIEAKCSNRASSCVIQHCITSLQLGHKIKRSDEKRSGIGSQDDTGSPRDYHVTPDVWKQLLLKKRGVNDITDVCIEYHCPRESPGTLSFLQCVSKNGCMGR